MKRILISTGGLLLLAFLLFVLFAVFANYSDGYRAGTIIKMSEKGMIFKTAEGQLNTGSFGGGLIWDFSVKRGDTAVLRQIEQAVDGGYRVKLYYKEKFYRLGILGDTKYFVYKVESVGETKGESSEILNKSGAATTN